MKDRDPILVSRFRTRYPASKVLSEQIQRDAAETANKRFNLSKYSLRDRKSITSAQDAKLLSSGEKGSGYADIWLEFERERPEDAWTMLWSFKRYCYLYVICAPDVENGTRQNELHHRDLDETSD